MNPIEPEWFFARMKQLQEGGLDHSYAFMQARMESAIAHWPEKWGDELQVLLYGDFEAPKEPVHFPELGILLEAGNLRKEISNLIIKSGFTVVKTFVTLDARTIEGITDAARRINILCGALNLVHWGNGAFHWWCYITHPSDGGVHLDFDKHVPDVRTITSAIVKLPPAVRQRIDAALYWIREPQQSMQEFYRNGLLRTYSAYWNAFECLTDAIEILRPMKKQSATEKQRRLDEFVLSCNGRLTVEDVQNCYRSIVNPGFVAKASHSLRVCFGPDADHYIAECFTRKPRRDRLYDIRNAIDHGDVDAENPHEQFRIATRVKRLWMIVWAMCGRIVPFAYPVDPETHEGKAIKAF